MGFPIRFGNDPKTETARRYCAIFVLKSTQKDQKR